MQIMLFVDQIWKLNDAGVTHWDSGAIHAGIMYVYVRHNNRW